LHLNREKPGTGGRRGRPAVPEALRVDHIDRVFVVSGAPTHIGFAFDICREFADRRHDLVARPGREVIEIDAGDAFSHSNTGMTQNTRLLRRPGDLGLLVAVYRGR
jgi:hypothetical protein